MPTSWLDLLRWTLSSLLLCLESTASVRPRRQLLSAPFSNQLSSRVPLPLPATPRFQVQKPCAGFAPKQTKESSAWRATSIVLHYLTYSCEDKRDYRLIDLVGNVFSNDPGDLGSIPGHVIAKTSKMILDTYLLNTQKYKVGIKGKVELSMERSRAPPPTARCSSYWKGSLLITLDYGAQHYFTLTLK